MRWFTRTFFAARHSARRQPLQTIRPVVEEFESRLAPSVNVLTYHNDNASSGQNLAETILTPGIVNAGSFGRLFSNSVAGQVYAQPLVMTGVNISTGALAGVHDVVFIATEHDRLYAFDANTGLLLWHDALLPSRYGGTVTSVPSSDVGTGLISPEIGITSTPVIDPTSNTLYVEEKTKEVVGSVSHYLHWLNAINVSNGAEKFGGPVVIADSIGDTYVSGPTVAGTGDTPNRTPTGKVAFDALRQLNRPALTLVNGTIYIAFASHGDNTPYHGWVLGYSAATLKLTAVFNATPNGSDGGIWQGGDGITADSSGNLYLETGNGTFDTTMDANGFPIDGDYGDSVIKLAVDPGSTAANQNGNRNGWGLKVVDYFTPFNQDSLDSGDLDLGSGGPVLLPASAGSMLHPNLLVASGKEGRIYLIDRDNMGKFDPNPVNKLDTNIVQELPPDTISGSYGSAAYFNGYIYYVGAANDGNPDDSAKAFSVQNAQLSVNPTSQGPDTFSYPGNTPIISADASSNGILWAVDTGTNELRAYDAGNLADELYTSDQAANNRDRLGSAVKFAPATEANGHVYVGTSNGLVAYGLLANVTASVTGSTLNITKTHGGNITLVISHAAGFQELTMTTNGTGTINYTATTFVTSVPVTAVAVNLGGGNDTLTFDGTAAAIDLAGSLTISGTGGSKTLTVLNTHVLGGGGLNMSLAGNGTETVTFTDVDVAGAAVISHPGTGATSFTLNTSNTLNRWGGLSITDGVGADINLISDTDFAGNVTINNGPGDPTITGAGGGSLTTFSAVNNATLLHISGNLVITSAGGQSDSELNDYNVHGSVTINTGAGITNQSVASFVGMENNAPLSASAGTPVIGGSVSITGAAVPGAATGLLLDLGTSNPLTIEGNLTINAGGSGSVVTNLQDLRVAGGATSITLGKHTSGDTVSVQGSAVTALFNSFSVSSSAAGNNTFNIQDQSGQTEFGGAVNFQLGAGSDTLNLAADSGSAAGVSGAVVELFSTAVFNGGAGTNQKFVGAANVFVVFTPQFSNFV